MTEDVHDFLRPTIATSVLKPVPDSEASLDTCEGPKSMWHQVINTKPAVPFFLLERKLLRPNL